MMDKWVVTWDELQDMMGEEKPVAKKELCLMIAVAFLYGMVLGIFLSPKKHVEFASNNVTMEGVSEKDQKKAKKCCEKRIAKKED